MTNQTHTAPLKDAGQKRREYLRKKGTTYSVAAAYAVISLISFNLAAIVFICGYCQALSQYISHWVIWWLGGSLIAGVGGFVGCQWARVRAIAIPYVPPVAEQIAVLPAKAILVRGSGQSAVASEELLRAARARETTEAEELMRPLEGH